jgi:methionyl-tRNA formyltransferase
VANARAVVFGYGDIGVRGTATLLDAGVEVTLVVTHADDPNETRWYASLYDFARGRQLRALADPPMEALEVGEPDLFFSYSDRSMLPMPLLRRARLGAFNMHGSLLPRFRGRAPLNWAIV